MIDLKRKYGFDKKAAVEGTKMFIGTDKETDWVLIKRMPSKDYIACLTKTLQDHGEELEQLRKEDPDAGEKYDQELQCEVLAKTVVVGWGGGIQENKISIPYSVEAAAKLLAEFDDFRIDCVSFARDNKNYPIKMNVEKVKKS